MLEMCPHRRSELVREIVAAAVLIVFACLAGRASSQQAEIVVSNTELTASSGSFGASSLLNGTAPCPENTTCSIVWTLRPAAWSPGKVVKLRVLAYMPVMASAASGATLSSSLALFDGPSTSSPVLETLTTQMITVFSSREYYVGEMGVATVRYSFPTSTDGAVALTFDLADDGGCGTGVTVVDADSGTFEVTAQLASRSSCSFVVAPARWNASCSMLIWLHSISDGVSSVSVFDGPTRNADAIYKQFVSYSLANVVVDGPAALIVMETTSGSLFLERKMLVTFELIPRRKPNCKSLGDCNGHGKCIGDGLCDCDDSVWGATPNCGSFCTSGCVHGTCRGLTCNCEPGWQGSACENGQATPGGLAPLTATNGSFAVAATEYTELLSYSDSRIQPEGWTPEHDIVLTIEFSSSYIYVSAVNFYATPQTSPYTARIHAPSVQIRMQQSTAPASINVTWSVEPHSLPSEHFGIAVVTEPSGTLSASADFTLNTAAGWLLRPNATNSAARIDATFSFVNSYMYTNYFFYDATGKQLVNYNYYTVTSPINFTSVSPSAVACSTYLQSATTNELTFSLDETRCSVFDFCSGHGACTEAENCSCFLGFDGENCSVPVPEPCQNGGTLVDGFCICAGNWIGATCETLSPCPRNGTVFRDAEWNFTITSLPASALPFTCELIIAPEVPAGHIIQFFYDCPSHGCNFAQIYSGVGISPSSTTVATLSPAQFSTADTSIGPYTISVPLWSAVHVASIGYRFVQEPAPTAWCKTTEPVFLTAATGSLDLPPRDPATYYTNCYYLIAPSEVPAELTSPAIHINFSFVSPSVTLNFYDGATLDIQSSFTFPAGVNTTNFTWTSTKPAVLLLLPSRYFDQSAYVYRSAEFSFEWSLVSLDCNCIHGACSSSGGVCECFAGWTGDSCDQPQCDGGCFHGTCTGPNLCTCDAGWAGQRCDSSDFCGKLDFVASTASEGSFHTSGTPPASSWTCVWRIERNTTSSEEAETVIEFRGLFFDLVCNASNVFEVSAGTATAAPLLRKGCFNTTRQTDPVYADEWPLVITASSVDSVGGFGGSFSLVPRSSAPHMTCHGVKVLSGSNGSISASKMQAETSCSWIIFFETQTVAGSSVLGIAVSRMTGGILTVHDGPGSFAPVISVFDQAPFVVNSTSAGKSLFVVWKTFDSDATDFLAFEWGLDVEHPALFSEDEETDESSICPQGCVNGRCTETGVCVCRTGWEGANCSTPICTFLPNGAVCTGPEIFECTPGFIRASYDCWPHPCPNTVVLSTELGGFFNDEPVVEHSNTISTWCYWLVVSHDGNPVRIRATSFNPVASLVVYNGNTSVDPRLCMQTSVTSPAKTIAHSQKTAVLVAAYFSQVRSLFELDFGTYDPAVYNPCNGHGFMSDSGACTCDFGWYGANCTSYACDDPVDSRMYCSWHGTCSTGATSCDCEPGYPSPLCFVQNDATVTEEFQCPDVNETADHGAIRTSSIGGMDSYNDLCSWTIAPAGLSSGKVLWMKMDFLRIFDRSGWQRSSKLEFSSQGKVLASYSQVTVRNPVEFFSTAPIKVFLTTSSELFALSTSIHWTLIDRVAASSLRSCTLLNNCSGHGVCNSQGTCSCLDGFSGADCSVYPAHIHGTCKDGACSCFDGWTGDACDVRTSCAGVQSLTALSGEIAFSSVHVAFANEPETCSWVIQPFWWTPGCVLRLRVMSIFSNSTVLSVSDGAVVLGSGQPLDPISFANRSQDQVVIESTTGKMTIDAAFASELEGFEASFCVMFNGECIEEPPAFSSSTSAIVSSELLRVSSSTPGSNTLLLALAIGIPALAVLIAIIVASACLAHRYFTTHEDAIEMAEINKLVKCSPESIDFSHNGKDLCRVGDVAACPFTLANLTDKRFTIEFKPRPSHKWEMTFDPPTLTLEPNEESAAATCKLKLLCTTVMSGVGVPMHVQGNEIGQLWVSAEGALSAMLDRDEIVLDRALGSGSFATVHTATWRGTSVAVKVFREHLFDIKDLAADVRREVDLCMNLRHPNIIQYFGAAISKTTACIVMELATNGSLGDAIKEHKLTVAAKFRMAHDVASGMLFLHTSHVIHRDLKPDNVLLMSLDPNAPVCGKLSDFGTSRTIGSSDSARTYTKGVGTPVFCAPEVLDGQKYSSGADVYSFSMLLWNLFSETVPYSHIESNYAVLKNVMEGKRPPMVDSIPEEIRSMIEGAWSHVPEERAEFAAIVLDLEQIMAANGTMPAHMTQQAASRHASTSSSSGARTSTKGRTKSRKPSPTSTAAATGEVPPPLPPQP